MRGLERRFSFHIGDTVETEPERPSGKTNPIVAPGILPKGEIRLVWIGPLKN
jgi:hypothetical protein